MLGTGPVLTVRSPTRGPSLRNCTIYTECQSQSHAGSLAVCSVSVSPSGPRLADSVSFLVVSIDPSGSYNPFPPFSGGFPNCTELTVGFWICFHQLLDKSSLVGDGKFRLHVCYFSKSKLESSLQISLCQNFTWPWNASPIPVDSLNTLTFPPAWSNSHHHPPSIHSWNLLYFPFPGSLFLY